MSWLYAKQRAHLSSLTLSLIFILCTLHNQISKPGPSLALKALHLLWSLGVFEKVFWDMYLFIGLPSNPFVIPFSLSVFHEQFGAEGILVPSLWARLAYMCNVLLLEQSTAEVLQGFQVPAWWEASVLSLAVKALEFENSCAGQSSKWMETPLQIFMPWIIFTEADTQKTQEYFPTEGPFLKGDFFCNTFPSCAIFKLMTEIASCQIRDGLRLPSVNCFIRGIMQPVSVVAVQAELSHMAGEAEGITRKRKTDSIF